MPAVLRSANPALNPKGWIVVPFGNVMKAQELSQYRVIRGGAFDTNDSLAAAWMRGYLKASALPAELPNTGFRCASG